MDKDSNEKIIEMLEEQLKASNKHISSLTKQVESLSEQIRQLTKLAFGSKREKSKYVDLNQPSLFDE